MFFLLSLLNQLGLSGFNLLFAANAKMVDLDLSQSLMITVFSISLVFVALIMLLVLVRIMAIVLGLIEPVKPANKK